MVEVELIQMLIRRLIPRTASETAQVEKKRLNDERIFEDSQIADSGRHLRKLTAHNARSEPL